MLAIDLLGGRFILLGTQPDIVDLIMGTSETQLLQRCFGVRRSQHIGVQRQECSLECLRVETYRGEPAQDREGPGVSAELVGVA